MTNRRRSLLFRIHGEGRSSERQGIRQIQRRIKSLVGEGGEEKLEREREEDGIG